MRTPAGLLEALWRTVHGPGGARPVRNRQDARRLAQADAEALIRDRGAEAYREARQRERDRSRRVSSFRGLPPLLICGTV